MADDKLDPTDGAESGGPEGRDLAGDLPDPKEDLAAQIDGDFDGIPDGEEPDEGFDLDNEKLAAATASASRRPRATAPRKKSAPTPKQRKGGLTDEETRTTPAKFVRESAEELKKVVWPTGEQVRTYFIVVLIFVLFIIAFVLGLDLAFGWGVLTLFGGGQG